MIIRDEELDFRGVDETNVEKLKRIHAATFPVHYNSKFYRELLRQNQSNEQQLKLSQLAYVRHHLVGALCTRLETTTAGQRRLYIMTLAVLPAYRCKGIGSRLLQSVLEHCQSADAGIEQVALHVQSSNEDALRFYVDRFGFTKGPLVENYYHRRIDPPHCYELTKSLLPVQKHEGHDASRVDPIAAPTSSSATTTTAEVSRTETLPTNQGNESATGGQKRSYMDDASPDVSPPPKRKR